MVREPQEDFSDRSLDQHRNEAERGFNVGVHFSVVPRGALKDRVPTRWLLKQQQQQLLLLRLLLAKEEPHSRARARGANEPWVDATSRLPPKGLDFDKTNRQRRR